MGTKSRAKRQWILYLMFAKWPDTCLQMNYVVSAGCVNKQLFSHLFVFFSRFSLFILQQPTAPAQTFSMPVTVQASNQSTLQFSNPGNALVTTSYVTSSSLTDTHLLSPQQPALQRNTVSPGLPQRPASAGERVVFCWVWWDWSHL